MKYLLIFIILIGLSCADNGSIAITRVDGEYVNILDNQLEDMIEFDLAENNWNVILSVDSYICDNHAMVNALKLLNCSMITNTTDLEIVKMVEIEYVRRQNEIAEIKREQEQAARDLVNRTHVNTYEWIKGEA
ncbi:MAG: hypothetical protein M0R80_03495 [Proteobacteria bacterium]|jgi:hypothetical protein|nr:hypothetical protein [Pseudomonadota bacterium]